MSVVNDPGADAKLRVEAAKVLLPYLQQKKGDKGKKEEKGDKAAVAGSGRFAPSASPKVVGIISR